MTSMDEAQARAPTVVIRDFLRNSISLSDVLRQLWTGRLILVAALLLGLLYGLYQAHRAGPMFAATMSIMPSEIDTQGGGGGGGAADMLASLTGGGGGSPIPKFTQFITSLGSVGVARELDRKYDMLCVQYRGLCDPKTHAWKKRTGMNAMFNAFLARVAGLPDPNGALTVVELAQMNAGAVVVTRDKVTGLTTLSYYNSNPKFAADYLNKIFHVTNDYVRDQDRSMLRTYVAYVTRRIDTNTNIAQREALDSLLLQQERKLMLAEVDLPYAAIVLDGPTVLPQNTVLRITVLDGFFFLLIGMAIVLFHPLVPPGFRFWSRLWPRS